MVLEGGSIDSNGAGLLLTTENCLLNPNRNPHLTRAEIEKRLVDFLGVEKVLWLGEGIAGDDTDGHIDDITRFVAPRVVVTAIEEDPTDENYQPLQENLRRLKSMTDLDGRPLEIVTIPMPPPVVYNDQRLPASYANFYIANTVVLLPTYNHANDERARAPSPAFSDAGNCRPRLHRHHLGPGRVSLLDATDTGPIAEVSAWGPTRAGFCRAVCSTPCE